MIRTVIQGTGHYLPEKIVKNSDFLHYEFYDNKGSRIDKSNEEIIRKFQEITEIEERRYVPENLSSSDIATIAAQRALEETAIDKEHLDYVITAHNYGDIHPISRQSDMLPSISARVKNKLGIKNNRCRPYDMVFGCPGWIEGLILADQLIKSGHARHILVTGSDTLSKVIDPHDRNAMIFSDGAGAAVLSTVETDQNIGILDYDSRSDNEEELNYLFNGPSINPYYTKSMVNISMNGRKIYEYALTIVPLILKKLLEKNNLEVKDIKKILIHQANSKMDHAILKRLLKFYNHPNDKKTCLDLMPMSIQKLGNSSVATVPTLLDRVLKGYMPPHELTPGDTILMASLGAGMNINAIIYRSFPTHNALPVF
ncbi:MAG: 3-oxoacyl-ACP synthase III family protein [Flavobacteriales bacterium Tduv]